MTGCDQLSHIGKPFSVRHKAFAKHSIDIVGRVLVPDKEGYETARTGQMEFERAGKIVPIFRPSEPFTG